MKPVKGIEEGLEVNLRSFFELKYPIFELIFCVAEENDPSIPLIQKLCDSFPNVGSKILIGEDPVGVNPKIKNIYKGSENASFDLQLISDSNVCVRPDYLQSLIAEMTENVGIVTALVVGRSNSWSWGPLLESISLNTFFFRWMVVADDLGQTCVIGKSILFKRSIIQRFGGLRALSSYLAEDYMVGFAIRQLGLKIRFTREPLYQSLQGHGVSDYWKRHIRWGRMRKATAPLWFLIEPLSNAFVLSGLGAFGLSRVSSLPFMGLMMLSLGLCLILDCMLIFRVERGLALRHLVGWALRELLFLPLWLVCISSNSVEWRGQKFRLLSGGLVARSDEKNRKEPEFVTLGLSPQARV